jgi:hypothetical protein
MLRSTVLRIYKSSKLLLIFSVEVLLVGAVYDIAAACWWALNKICYVNDDIGCNNPLPFPNSSLSW